MFFRGNTIYSYGHHYEAAKHCNYNGKDFVLISDDSPSNTTNGHLSDIRRAVRHKTVFSVPNVENYDTIEKAKDYYDNVAVRMAKGIEEAKSKPSKAVKYEALLRHERSRIEIYDFMGINYQPLNMDHRAMREIVDEHNAKVEARRATAPQRRSEREERRKREQVIKYADNITAWRVGQYHSSLRYVPTMLRINHVDKTVETSIGASFPLEHAIKALPYVLRIVNGVGSKYYRLSNNDTTLRLGHYMIDSIDGNGLKAGCHVISREEVNHFAALVESLSMESKLEKDKDQSTVQPTMPELQA